MTSVLDTYMENRFRVQPNHSNSYGTVHGGSVMKWLDELGAMAAMRLAGETCVTAQMGAVNFETPVPTGETVVIEAYAYEAGSSSIDVNLIGYRENPRTGEREPLTDPIATYVAVDADGNPTDVPPLEVETERGEELIERARAAAQEPSPR